MNSILYQSARLKMISNWMQLAQSNFPCLVFQDGNDPDAYAVAVKESADAVQGMASGLASFFWEVSS